MYNLYSGTGEDIKQPRVNNYNENIQQLDLEIQQLTSAKEQLVKGTGAKWRSFKVQLLCMLAGEDGEA